MKMRPSYPVSLVLVLACSLMACDDDSVAPPPDDTGQPAWTPMQSGTTENINAVWAASASDVFAVGDGGTILRFNGSAWNALDSGVTDNLHGVWGTSGSHVLASSESGDILVFDGSNWTPTTGITTSPVGRISGVNANFIVAAGGGPNGSYLQFNGANWSVKSTGGAEAISDAAPAVSDAAGPLMVLVGEGGVAFAALEDTVIALPTGTSSNLTAVAEASDGSVIAVGSNGTILAIDPPAVRELIAPSAQLAGIALRGYNDLFVSAADGTIFGSDRCQSKTLKASGPFLRDLSAGYGNRVIAVGDGGTILSYSTAPVAGCPDNVSISVSAGLTPTFSWSPGCRVNLVLVEEAASDMWLVWGDGNVIGPGVRYGDHHPCETEFTYEGPLQAGVTYEVILFRYDEDADDYTLIGLKTFVP